MPAASYWLAPAALLVLQKQAKEQSFWASICFSVFRESCGRSSFVHDASMILPHVQKNKKRGTHLLLMDWSENQDWLLNSCLQVLEMRPRILSMTDYFIFLLQVKVPSFWHHCFLICCFEILPYCYRMKSALHFLSLSPLRKKWQNEAKVTSFELSFL